MKQSWIGLVCILFAGTCFGMSGSEGAETQPNILVILVDDLGYHDLGCQGASDISTPNIDRLAASGVRFTDGYVTAPQCGPSRAGLMTGVSQARFGYLDISMQRGMPSADVLPTLSEQLKARNYATGLIGKWHIGFQENGEHKHFTLPGNHPWERGFDYVLMHNGGMSHYYPYREDGKRWMVSRGREYRLQQKMENEPGPRLLDDLPADTYLTDYFSEQAALFIERNQEKPWFLYLAYNAPHTPCVAKADKLEKHAQIENPMRRTLVAMMDSLDEGVGKVLDELEKTGQTRNTLVFFLSDNGAPTHENGSLNDPFSGKKGDVHEGGIRVPFIAAWPGTIPAKQVLSGPVISLDILPTALSASGIRELPPIYEGKDLLPWLQGKSPCPNKQLYWSWRSKAAIRNGTLKETRNGNAVKAMDGSAVPGHVFCDLKVNPEERAEEALQNPEKKKMLSDSLDQWLKKLKQDQATLTPKY